MSEYIYTGMSKKTSARLRELAPSSVASSRNLADVFLDNPVYMDRDRDTQPLVVTQLGIVLPRKVKNNC